MAIMIILMKKQRLMKHLSDIATDKGVELRLSRQGKHEVWLFGAERLVIPRHNEIDEYTAMAIIRQARESARRSVL